MKKLSLLAILTFALMLNVKAQQRLTYQMYHLGSDSGDTTFTEVQRFANNQLKIQNLPVLTDEEISQMIPGISRDLTYIDYNTDSAYYQMSFADGDSFYASMSLKNSSVKFTEEGEELMNGYNCKKYRTSINSNTIEVWMT